MRFVLFAVACSLILLPPSGADPVDECPSSGPTFVVCITNVAVAAPMGAVVMGTHNAAEVAAYVTSCAIPLPTGGSLTLPLVEASYTSPGPGAGPLVCTSLGGTCAVTPPPAAGEPCIFASILRDELTHVSAVPANLLDGELEATVSGFGLTGQPITYVDFHSAYHDGAFILAAVACDVAELTFDPSGANCFPESP